MAKKNGTKGKEKKGSRRELLCDEDQKIAN
jgi:hypothetical protein